MFLEKDNMLKKYGIEASIESKPKPVAVCPAFGLLCLGEFPARGLAASGLTGIN